jgi:tetratricopeptide (TPR) repeat protein
MNVIYNQKLDMWLVGVIVCAGWIFSLCIHEFSHAIVAYWGGDTSVKSKGYLTFNPLKYTDPGNSLLLPLLFLLMGGLGLPGGAVYINTHRLRSRWWQSLVSAAGPTANIVTAMLLATCLGLITPHDLGSYSDNSQTSAILASVAFLIYLEIFSVIFNLLPIPGLDGYGIIQPWLPANIQAKAKRISKYSILIIIGLFWFVPAFGSFVFELVRVFVNILQVPTELVRSGSQLFRAPINRLIALAIILTLAYFYKAVEKPTSPADELIKQQQYVEAIAFFDQEIQQDPDNVKAWEQKAYCLWSLEQVAAAQECFLQVLKIDEYNSYAYYGLGIIAYEAQEYSETVSYLDRLFKIDPDYSANGHYYLGLAYQHLEEYQLSVNAFDRGLSLAPNNTDLLFSKATSLHEMTNYQAAIDILRQIIKIEPNGSTAWYNMACCYALSSNVEQAIFNLQKAAQLDPELTKNKAQADPDFAILQDSAAFQQIIV